MLFFIRFTIRQPIAMTQKDLYTVWVKEAAAALEAKKAGVVKGLYKVSGLRQVLAILDVPSNRDLDNALSGLPIIKEHGHSVELEILPIQPYEEYYEDMKKVLDRA